MIKTFEHILLKTALTIIALHAIIAHPHSDELTAEEHFELHRQSNSLIGTIRLVFHEKDDENLDNIIIVRYDYLNKTDNKYEHTNVSIFINLHCFTIKNETVRIINQNTFNFDAFLFVKLNRLRGPPVFT